MSRTIRKTLIKKAGRNTTKLESIVPDGKCDYKCKCSYCVTGKQYNYKRKIKLKEELEYIESELMRN